MKEVRERVEQKVESLERGLEDLAKRLSKISLFKSLGELKQQMVDEGWCEGVVAFVGELEEVLDKLHSSEVHVERYRSKEEYRPGEVSIVCRLSPIFEEEHLLLTSDGEVSVLVQTECGLYSAPLSGLTLTRLLKSYRKTPLTQW